jgi:hypothetical protein
MTTLQEYVAREFPNHEIEAWEGARAEELELAPHTVVSHVVGTRDGLDVLNTFRQKAPRARVAALAVRPSSPSVVPTHDESPEGPLDVPTRRVATSMAIGAIVVGAGFGLLMALLHQSASAAAIVGVFAAVVGAAVGAIVSGARFAGQRGSMQPQAPGRTITVVAAFCDDDASANSLATAVGPVVDYDVRILDEGGGWRSPSEG